MKEPTEEIYIEITPNCKLVPENTYYLSSDPEEHEVTPLVKKNETLLSFNLYKYKITYQCP